MASSRFREPGGAAVPADAGLRVPVANQLLTCGDVMLFGVVSESCVVLRVCADGDLDATSTVSESPE